jgi:hypothetical protein
MSHFLKLPDLHAGGSWRELEGAVGSWRELSPFTSHLLKACFVPSIRLSISMWDQTLSPESEAALLMRPVTQRPWRKETFPSFHSVLSPDPLISK